MITKKPISAKITWETGTRAHEALEVTLTPLIGIARFPKPYSFPSHEDEKEYDKAREDYKNPLERFGLHDRFEVHTITIRCLKIVLAANSREKHGRPHATNIIHKETYGSKKRENGGENCGDTEGGERFEKRETEIFPICKDGPSVREEQRKELLESGPRHLRLKLTKSRH